MATPAEIRKRQEEEMEEFGDCIRQLREEERARYRD